MKNLTQEQKRLLLERDKRLDKKIHSILTKIGGKYRPIAKAVTKDILDLVRDTRDEEVPLRNYLNMQYYQRILYTIERKLHELALWEKQLLEEEMIEFYIVCFWYDPLGGQATREQAVNAVDEAWCSDGKHWWERIGEHNGKLYTRLDSTLMDVLVSKPSTEEVERLIKKEFDQAYNEDKTLVDTEFTHIMNKTNEDKYAQKGVQNFLYVCVHDERTCTACLERDGKVFRVGDPINTPGLHPNCRCQTIPITNNNYLI